MKKRILVVGGSYFPHEEDVTGPLSYLAQWFERDACIICGNDTMVDRVVRKWAHSRGLCCIQVSEAVSYYNRTAANERDRWFMQYTNPDLVVMLPGTIHTSNIAQRAKALGIDVHQV